MSKKVLLITAAAIMLSTTAASAQVVINTKQNNIAATIAQANVAISRTNSDVGGKVDVTVAAIGNSASATTNQNATIVNEQDNVSRVAADLNLVVQGGVKDVTATTAAIANSASFKVDNAGTNPTNVYNTQSVWTGAPTVANLASQIVGVTGNVNQTSAAIGNSFSADVKGPIGTVNNAQFYWGDVRSNLDTQVRNVTGDVTATSAAICNSGTVNARDAASIAVNNWQACNIDPTATTTAVIQNVGGKVNLTTAAIGNSFSLTTLPTSTLAVANRQQNAAINIASSNVALQNVAGDVALTTAAIGNSFTITGGTN